MPRLRLLGGLCAALLAGTGCTTAGRANPPPTESTRDSDAPRLEEAESLYRRAFTLGGEGKAAEALPDALRATELDARKSRYWELLGMLYLQLEKPAEARAALDKVLALEPGNAQAHLLLGTLLVDEGRNDEALAAYEKARAARPDFTLAHYNAGQLHHQRGELSAALECFQKAAELEPEDWKIRAKLVQVHQALGDKARRDSERESLLLLRQAGKVDKEYFIRDEFTVGSQHVMVVENFELEGDWARRYEFQVYTPGQERPSLVITLGSYAFVNALRQEKDAQGPRLFHLDGYHPDDAHDTYGFFQGEPSYDDTRERVLAILQGQLAPMSTTKPRAQ